MARIATTHTARLVAFGFASWICLGAIGCKQPRPPAAAAEEDSTAQATSIDPVDKVVATEPTHAVAVDRSELNSSDSASATELVPPATAPRPQNGPELRAEAVLFFNELIERVPNDPDALEVKARYHLLVGETQLAKECWEQALQLAPDYAYAWHGLGKVALAAGDVEAAVDWFEKSRVAQSGNLDLLHDLSDAYMKLGRIDEAIKLLNDTAEQAPKSTLTWVLLGQAQLSRRQFDEARTSFEQALQLSPNLPRAQQGLGTALLRLGKRDEARKLLEAQQAQRTSGKNRSEQETFADELTEIAKRYVFAGRVYQQHKDYVRAEYSVRRATVFHPQNEQAWSFLITFYTKQRRPSDAIAAAEEMCRIDNDNASYHYTLGVLYRQQKKQAEARAQFADVMRLAPTSPVGYEAQARLLLGERHELSSTIPLARKLVELRGSAADYELLAQTQAINEHYQDAQQSLTRALEMDPNNLAYKEAMRQLQSVLESTNE